MLDSFWSEYTKFNHKNDHFYLNDFIWITKDICGGNSHLWHQQYSLPSTKVLGVIAYRVNSKMLGIGYADHSWVGVKTIMSGKRSSLGSDIFDNHSIVYISSCVEEAII